MACAVRTVAVLSCGSSEHAERLPSNADTTIWQVNLKCPHMVKVSHPVMQSPHMVKVSHPVMQSLLKVAMILPPTSMGPDSQTSWLPSTCDSCSEKCALAALPHVPQSLMLDCTS